MTAEKVEFIFGILAGVIVVFAYLCKKKWQMLFLFAFSNLSVAVSLLALGKYDSTTLYFLGFAQTFINGILALKGKEPPVWSSVIFFISFTSVSAVKLISDWQSPVDILPLLATMTFVISFAQKDQQKIRLISLFNLIFWATYFFLVHSTAIWTELIAIAADIYSMIRARKAVSSEDASQSNEP